MPDDDLELADAIADGLVGDRVWLYANYHCNLACAYCLTGSSPRAPRRVLGRATMLALADDAVRLGFRRLGVTGGEPFLNRWLPEAIAALADRLPVVVLTNGTLFTPRLLARCAPLARPDVALQISLDSADPAENDAMRGPENHARAVQAIAALVALGVRVRVATTLDRQSDVDLDRLVALRRDLGVADDDHVIRPIITRGRARDGGLGVAAGQPELFPELAVTAEGAFWSPFGATAAPDGPLDEDLLLTRAVAPLDAAARALVAAVRARPAGADALLGVR